MNVRPSLYAEELHKKNSDALGFIPRSRLESYERNGQILIQKEGGDECGYLIFGKGWPYLRIYQACIDYDVRRQKHGFSLVSKLVKEAGKRHEKILLRCRENLEANIFWEAAGFSLLRSEPGGKRRNKNINVWQLDIKNPLQMSLL
jgi:ribosomal protein S18 acetylase RimI-like enzyme